MKLSLPALFVLCLFFTSCNHHPTDESQEAKAMDTAAVETQTAMDSLILKEPIASSAKHYFSDSLYKDSFAVEAPAGDLLKSSIYIRVYNNSNGLIFFDSIPPAEFFDDQANNEGNAQTEIAINGVRRGIAGFLGNDNFSPAGKEEAIKNTSAGQITNMIGFNEAVADSNKIVFNFFNSYKGTSYVTYSQKLKKAIVIVQVEDQGED